MRIIEKKSKIRCFSSWEESFEAEIKVETDDGNILYFWGYDVVGIRGYELRINSIYDMDQDDAENKETDRIEEFESPEAALKSKYIIYYLTLSQMLDEIVEWEDSFKLKTN